MKFIPINIQNHKIATYHSEGEGETFVFIHANSIGAASFYKQMMSDEGKKHRFISIDMPGHGASDFSLQPREVYTIDSIANIMTETLNRLNIDKCILVGHSFGAHVALRMVNKLDTFKGLVLANMCPIKNYSDLSDAYKVNDIFNIFFKPKLNEYDCSKLAQIFVKDNTMADIAFVDNIKNTDPNFRFVLGESFKTDIANDFDLIEKIDTPVTLIFGEKDRIIDYKTIKHLGIENKLWRNKIQVISDAGHSPMWEKTSVFNYILDKFAKDL